MPDLQRERRNRSRQPLDRRVSVTLEGGGARNQFGEWVPGTQTILAWARRDDDATIQGRDLSEAGFRVEASTAYVMRHNPLIGPGAVINDNGREFRIDRVEEVGRRRYIRATGAYST